MAAWAWHPALRPRLDGDAWLQTGRSQAERARRGVAQLNTLKTVRTRDTAFGDGTVSMRNAQSPHLSEPRYGVCVTHALGQPSCRVVRWVPGVYAHVTSPRSLLGYNEGGSPLYYTLLLGGVWCIGGTLTFGLFVFRYPNALTYIFEFRHFTSPIPLLGPGTLYSL